MPLTLSERLREETEARDDRGAGADRPYAEELGAQGATLDLAIDAAAPIDLAAAANANVAAPIDAAVGANVLSSGSTAQALSDQGALVDQNVTADATQGSGLDQSDDVVDGGTGATAWTMLPTPPAPVALPARRAPQQPTDGGQTPGDATSGVGSTAPGTVGDVTNAATDTTSGALDGALRNVDVKLDADADIAAPINGAVAANVGSVDSDAVAVSQQDAIINQNIDGSAEATSDQQSDIEQ